MIYQTTNLTRNFSELDDHDIYSCIKEWKNNSDFVLSTLCKRIIHREPLKIKFRTLLFWGGYTNSKNKTKNILNWMIMS